MTAPVTDEQLAEIRARRDAATDGPWKCDGPNVFVAKGNVATCEDINHIGDSEANAEFIASARDDVPTLVREVERLCAELARATKWRKEVDGRWRTFTLVVAPAHVAAIGALEGFLGMRVLVDVSVITADTKNDYVPWSVAGGPNECFHGYAEGIACKECDLAGGRVEPASHGCAMFVDTCYAQSPDGRHFCVFGRGHSVNYHSCYPHNWPVEPAKDGAK